MSNLSELLPSGGGQNEVEFVASGTLPNGQAVILNANGTVTAVAGSGAAQNIPSGSNVIYTTGKANQNSIAFDPNTANKFAITFSDDANSNYGKIVIGTLSGNSMSFGSAVVFNSAYTEPTKVAFDPNTANKLVVCFKDTGTSGNGTAVVGTVSGTSVSFGSKVVFNSGTTSSFDVKFDPINSGGKLVIAYYPANGQGTAVVGTVSGTSVSFGSAVVFSSGAPNYIQLSFDPNTSNKFAIVYRNSSSSGYGFGIVGTLSGTSTSYGSAAVFNSTAVEFIGMAFEKSVSGRFIIAYGAAVSGTDPNTLAIIGNVSGTSITYGTSAIVATGGTQGVIAVACDDSVANQAIIGFTPNYLTGGHIYPTTINGNAITFGTPVVFNTAAVTWQAVNFDPNTSGKFVYVYNDPSNTSDGTAFVGLMNTLSTNLTSTNLIGISAEAITSGATGVINTWGGLNEGQSSLTPASIYYVQGNGTISTVSTSPAQKIGQAISATTLNILDL